MIRVRTNPRAHSSSRKSARSGSIERARSRPPSRWSLAGFASVFRALALSNRGDAHLPCSAASRRRLPTSRHSTGSIEQLESRSSSPYPGSRSSETSYRTAWIVGPQHEQRTREAVRHAEEAGDDLQGLVPALSGADASARGGRPGGGETTRGAGVRARASAGRQRRSAWLSRCLGGACVRRPGRCEHQQSPRPRK